MKKYVVIVVSKMLVCGLAWPFSLPTKARHDSLVPFSGPIKIGLLYYNPGRKLAIDQVGKIKPVYPYSMDLII
jgi:hypothetical protein